MAGGHQVAELLLALLVRNGRRVLCELRLALARWKQWRGHCLHLRSARAGASAFILLLRLNLVIVYYLLLLIQATGGMSTLNKERRLMRLLRIRPRLLFPHLKLLIVLQIVLQSRLPKIVVVNCVQIFSAVHNFVDFTFIVGSRLIEFFQGVVPFLLRLGIFIVFLLVINEVGQREHLLITSID